ncbi:MAG: sensor histidine kinase N-terminal domain-containing protein, partial [Caulobacteraceae bacterium]|nr:sensor histidine kinase N-terminal domain-containing protein [Caulobacteraceae bacterium]
MVLAAAWSLAVLVVAGFALSAFFSRASVNRFDDELADTVDSLVAGISVENGLPAPPAFADPRSLRAYSGEYWEIATFGGDLGIRALVRSRSLWDRALPPPRRGAAQLELRRGEVQFYDAVGPLNRPLRVAALRVRLPEMTGPVIVMAAEDRSPVDADVRRFDTTVATTLLLLGAGLIAAVILQVRVGLRPLFELRREVADLRTGRAERVHGAYPNELEPLASELNALIAHNQEVLERQRTHVGNLAHALKTPLSVMTSEASGQEGALAETVSRQATLMGQQIDHHLRRARAAARAQGQGERTPVAPVVDELARTLERIFRGKVRAIDWRAPDDLAFQGERQDLLEIAGNVMENACKWCAASVRVSAERRDGRRLALVVEDDGPGLAPDQRAA